MLKISQSQTSASLYAPIKLEVTQKLKTSLTKDERQAGFDKQIEKHEKKLYNCAEMLQHKISKLERSIEITSSKLELAQVDKRLSYEASLLGKLATFKVKLHKCVERRKFLIANPDIVEFLQTYEEDQEIFQDV
jgi:hypothetical protein